jgi:hypothetical protein
MVNTLHLITEELIANIVVPQHGACSLCLDFSEKLENYELTVSYAGESSNALETTGDELPVMMVRKSAKTILHEYADGKNIIKVTL